MFVRTINILNGGKVNKRRYITLIFIDWMQSVTFLISSIWMESYCQSIFDNFFLFLRSQSYSYTEFLYLLMNFLITQTKYDLDTYPYVVIYSYLFMEMYTIIINNVSIKCIYIYRLIQTEFIELMHLIIIYTFFWQFE